MPRWAAFAAWGLLVAVSAGFSPPARPDQAAWLWDLLRGDGAGEDPSVVAWFQLMGVWPMVWFALLADDLDDRPVPAWPFVAGSIALGAFVLLPWFWFGPPRTQAAHGALRRVAGSRAFAWLWAAVAAGLFAWGLGAGDLAALDAARREQAFLWVMGWDFLTLWGMSVVVARSRDGGAGGRWWITLIPCLGAAVWAALRAGDRR